LDCSDKRRWDGYDQRLARESEHRGILQFDGNHGCDLS
jgi:hypothetical protein